MTPDDFRHVDWNVGYSVKEIATSHDDLLCWRLDENQRNTIVQQARDRGITFLPVRPQDKIMGVIRTEDLAGARPYMNLTVDWLIAADTTILHLIELFARNQDAIFFVLQSSEIEGLVAPADLNKIPARASVYLLLAHFEARLADLIRKVVGEEEAAFADYISNDRLSKLRDDRAKAKSRDINLSLLYYMYLTDLVTIVSKHKKLRKLFNFKSRAETENQMSSVIALRNRVDHPTNLLVASRGELAEIDGACRRLIEYGATIQRNLAEYQYQDETRLNQPADPSMSHPEN